MSNAPDKKTTTPDVPKVSKPPPPKTKAPPPAAKASAKKLTGKTFRVEDWDRGNEGLRIGLVAGPGMGKTTLASMAPEPVFVGLDEGGREIRNPITGKKLKHVPDVEDYYDVLGTIRQPSLFDNYNTVVFDTITLVETWMAPWVIENIKKERGGTAKNIVDYGWSQGFQHIYDTFTGFLADCDSLIRAGKNVILVGQSHAAKTVNEAGDDYLCSNVRLQNRKENNIAQFNEWCDHVLRIGYLDINVTDKKAKGTTERGIFFKPEPHYFAKSRTLPLDADYVPFESPSDDSIWKMLF